MHTETIQHVLDFLILLSFRVSLPVPQVQV